MFQTSRYNSYNYDKKNVSLTLIFLVWSSACDHLAPISFSFQVHSSPIHAKNHFVNISLITCKNFNAYLIKLEGFHAIIQSLFSYFA